jgi:drug/metabolite transporter (DMT)-like permease
MPTDTNTRVSRFVRLRREAWGFAIGSLCFAVGAIPYYAQTVGDVINNVTFFVGALFFTAAAFIQLALSGRPSASEQWSRPDRLDWWASAVQFGGTLFFNVSTTDALVTSINSGTRLDSGWRPDVFGSVAFLVSSVLAVIATTERDALWDPNARIWRCTWLNMLGSVFFGISAIGAFVIPQTGDLVSLFWANLGTLLGALCFFTAAVLSRPAADTAQGPRTAQPG